MVARCRNAIDYTKKINPIAENAILDALELEILLSDARLKGSNIYTPEGDKQGISSSSVERISDELLCWLSNKRKESNNSRTLESKAERWEALYNNNNK